jgi:hypothetical protein
MPKAKRNWERRATVDVPFPVTGDEKIWRLYSLCLVINRHCPDCWSDDDVSSALNKMAERLPLPHGFDFETWSPR